MSPVIIFPLICILFTLTIGMPHNKDSTAQPPVGGQGGSVPGGIGQCQAITPFHKEVANFAVQNLGTGYSLQNIVGVREQIVAGTMYHMELHVCSENSDTHYEYCNVKVVHRPWESPVLSIYSLVCEETCLFSK